MAYSGPVWPWNSVKEFEDFRQHVRALFYTVREALAGAGR